MLADNAIGDAAHYDIRQRTPAFGTNHDQRHVFLLRNSFDLLEGNAFAQENLWFQAKEFEVDTDTLQPLAIPKIEFIHPVGEMRPEMTNILNMQNDDLPRASITQLFDHS